MKSLVLFFCIVSFNSLQAQFTKGQKVIDGQFIFNAQLTQNTYNPSSPISAISTSFSLLRFTNPTQMKGFGVHLGYSNFDPNNFNFYVGTFYQIIQLEQLYKKIYISFSGQAGFNYGYFHIFNPGFTGVTQIKNNSLSPYASVNLGLLYQLNSRFILHTYLVNLASLTYQWNRADYYNGPNSILYSNNQNSISFHSGLGQISMNSFIFGFKWIIKK